MDARLDTTLVIREPESKKLCVEGDVEPLVTLWSWCPGRSKFRPRAVVRRGAGTVVWSRGQEQEEQDNEEDEENVPFFRSKWSNIVRQPPVVCYAVILLVKQLRYLL